MIERPISPKVLAALEQRGIDPETAIRYGVFTAKAERDGDGKVTMVPDAKGTVVAFPTSTTAGRST